MTGDGSAPERGVSPFTVFGVALVVAAAFALWEGYAYSPTATFTPAALPVLLGATVAVVLILLLGWRAPPNE